MRHLIAQLGEHRQRADGHEHPLHHAEQALPHRVQVACRGIQIRHELAVGAGRQVPRQVHGHQEHDGLDVDGVLQRVGHHAAERLVLARVVLLLRPVLGLLQLALQVPRDKGNHEQHQEQDARGQQAVEGAVGAGRQQRLPVCREAGQREGQGQGQKEDDGRAAAPCELADADVRGALGGRGRFRDVAPRCGDARSHRQAGEHHAHHHHGQVHGAHGDGHADRVHQQVVAIDDGAAVLVGQKAADERADGRAERVRADSA